MGCRLYRAGDTWVRFAEEDDSCLCTFPDRDVFDMNSLDNDRLRSLALLGAVVALTSVNEGLKDGKILPYSYIPFCVPDWIVKEIHRLTPLPHEEEPG